MRSGVYIHDTITLIQYIIAISRTLFIKNEKNFLCREIFPPTLNHPKTNFESSESHSKIVLQTFQLSKAQMQQLMKSYYIFWKLHKYSLRKYHRKGFPACYVLMLIQNQKSSSFEVMISEVHFWYQCSISKYQKARHVSDILYSACIF